jgi:L-asparaginase II
MYNSSYLPIFELTRGDVVESIHHGAIAVVDVYGRLLASYGDPEVVTYLRSTAKPFQALPFLERCGQEFYGLNDREVALMCASHSGTDEHMRVLLDIQKKVGVCEADLMCGIHTPGDAPTAETLRARNEQPTPNRHNCSGKHTGMLALVRLDKIMAKYTTVDLPYIDPTHPIQRVIKRTFAEMCAYPEQQIAVGIDGCSAPNFALPLRYAALGYARLCDPDTGGVEPSKRAAACHTITSAMTNNPDMVGGPGKMDTRLMEVAGGRLVAKGGAEGYQGIGLMPGALGNESPAVGIALKIADGDARGRISRSVALEILRQLGALSPLELELLAEFGPTIILTNWRKLTVGQGRPTFTMDRIA